MSGEAEAGVGRRKLGNARGAGDTGRSQNGRAPISF